MVNKFLYNHFALLASFLISHSVYSQLTTNGGSIFSASPYDNPAYAQIAGNPYIPLSFQKGFATRKTGEIDTVQARIDMYGGHIEILKADKKVLIAKSQYKKIEIFVIDEGFLLFKNGFKNKDWENENGFYQVLYDGKTKLLKHIIQVVRDCYEYGDTYKKCFKKQEKIYLQITDNEYLVRIDDNREKIWEVLKDIPQLKEYATSQKWKLKRWEDVAKILTYYDSRP